MQNYIMRIKRKVSIKRQTHRQIPPILAVLVFSGLFKKFISFIGGISLSHTAEALLRRRTHSHAPI